MTLDDFVIVWILGVLSGSIITALGLSMFVGLKERDPSTGDG